MGTTRLYLTTTVEEQWQAVLSPWLKEHAGRAWRNPKPTVVLTPSRAESFSLRSRLVEARLSFLGLRFWTPSDARKFLLGKLLPDTRSTSQAELRLLARFCAENLLQGKDVPEQATLVSVAREPNAFLRAYDLLLGAGWDPAQDGELHGRLLAREMTRELERRKIFTQAGVHRQLWRQSAKQPEPLLAHLLVAGFNAAHWPLWDLLRSGVACAEHSVVALSAPRVFAEDIDQLWISSWEESSGASAEIPDSVIREGTPEAFASLVASYERGALIEAPAENVTFLVTPELASQARAIALQTLAYLQHKSCTRLGIVFPEADALALGVAGHLREFGVPFDDGTGTIQPGLFEKRFWKNWIELLEEPSVSHLMQWVRACEAQQVSCGVEGLSARDVADVLENALGETLVDDLDFLRRHLEETSSHRRNRAVADFLRKRIALPPEACFAEFLAQTRAAVETLGWKEHLDSLPIDPPPPWGETGAILSRRAFLEWLKESTDSRERTRGADGNHFYGKVHLLVYGQMTGQTWSHLILTGLNEGVWPRLFETGAFGSRHELTVLNQQARSLNRLGTTQGRQGMGHESVRANRGHCLLPIERRDLALRDLCAALEGTSEAICLTALTTEEGHSLLPSDFFNHAYQVKTGQVLEETRFQDLAETASVWCRRHANLFHREKTETKSAPDITATRIAYAARRDAQQPFGPYEFSYHPPPALPIQLSCKTWEQAWNYPSSVWLQEVIGVAPWPEGTLSWPRATGTWVHRWLAAALRACREKNSTENFLSLLQNEADAELRRVQERAQSVGLNLYPWWEQVHGQARSLALGLGEALAPHLPGRQLLSEFTLPKEIRARLPGSNEADFALKGRIDLLLVEAGALTGDLAQGDFSGCTCWVIDFKTGSAGTLTNKKIGNGTGLQALLYALAVRTLGAGPTALSLLTLDAPLKMQVYLDQALESESLFRSLNTFHRAGIFGQRGNMENEHSYAPALPMATRLVSDAILKAKWELVHGAVPPSGEEEL